MTRRQAPKIERRRAADFERELLARARIWAPDWSLDENDADFGRALIKVAARFNSEVAERLDRAGEKMAAGFLDWLGLTPLAARPARIPVVMKMADTARDSVLALHPVKLQADVPGATVTFETETDLQVIPGQIGAMVAVDPQTDRFYLPPPGLTSLGPTPGLPNSWRLKTFAAADTRTLQLDPGIGLAGDMLVEIAGEQYRVVRAAGDLVSIDPGLTPNDGLPSGTIVTRVDAFRPFDGARNLQAHILYIGDSELLNVKANARIEVRGLGVVPDETIWEYWGKSEPEDPADADARWRDLRVLQASPPSASALTLEKPLGSMEATTIGNVESRWIRARLTTSTAMQSSDDITLRINPLASPGALPSELEPPLDWSKIGRPEIFVNSTPSPASKFYPLGRQPRLFDTLYIGSQDAFSKKGATAWVQFDLSDALFQSIAAINAPGIGWVLASTDARGALHLLQMDSQGRISRLTSREPMRPDDVDLLPGIPPIMWMVGPNLHVAVASKTRIHVWKEVRPAAEQSNWEDHGAPRGGASPDDAITGLARVNWGAATLVAARGGKLSTKSVSAAADPWSPHGVGFDVASIVPVQTQPAGLTPTRLLAIESGTPSALFDVRSVAETRLLDNIDPTVQPAAVENDPGGSRTLEVITADEGRTRLRASTNGVEQISPVLRDDLEIAANSQVGGRWEDSHLTGHAIAATSDASGEQALLSWHPSGFEDVVFEKPVDTAPSKVKGPMTIVPVTAQQAVALLPGIARGEIFGATLSGVRSSFNVPLSQLVSALATLPADTPATGDTIVWADATNLFQTDITGGGTGGMGDLGDREFTWLADHLPVPSREQDILIFDQAAAAAAEQVKRHSATEVEFSPTPTIAPAWIRVGDGAGNPGDVLRISDFDATTGVATADPNSVPAGPAIAYWLPDREISGRVVPAVELTGIVVSEDALERGTIYAPDLDPDPQELAAIALTPAGDPVAIAFDRAWRFLPAGATSFAIDGSVASWASLFGVADVNPALSWEYWDGAGWTHLAVGAADDSTNNLRNSGSVRFTVPSDIQAAEWAGKTNYWVRARLIGGDYGEEQVVVVTEPVPGTNKTTQTVERHPEGVQPPYALDVGVAYAMGGAITPTFLLTQDSGSLRNQSDANRVAGAEVEIFTPLAATLGRLDAPEVHEHAADECAPDCDCPVGEASMSATTRPDSTNPSGASAVASAASKRAIYLGFTVRPVGQPVAILFDIALERDFDAVGPLEVAALTGDRLTPILSTDDSRALGETGLLKMAIDVAPVQAELFGQSLFWLRLTPRAGSEDWQPSLAGAYLNGVWAHSAETMTRELLGSSDGRPQLTVNLARPPLLRNSLELRVREPLGEEELAQLATEDPDRVRTDVIDLPGYWILWKQVPDPGDCGPYDRVFSLDETSGRVRFGDGLHGAIPPIGVDAIVAFAYERTEPPIGDQVLANQVRARSELNLVTPVAGVEAVVAVDSAAGGVAPETAAHVLQFAPATLRHGNRAVSLGDLEVLARQRSEAVAQARALRRNGRIRLVVVTRGASPLPSLAQQRELRRMLLELSPPAVGAPGVLTVTGPRIRRLQVSLHLRVESIDAGGAVASEAKSRLAGRFDPAAGWGLGRDAREEDVAEGLLDIDGLLSIVSIGLAELDDAAGARPWQGAVAADQLVLLAAEDVRVTFDVLLEQAA